MTDDTICMNAYYYGFDPTGVPEIDLILSAVANAGQSFHQTEDWGQKLDRPPFGHTGESPTEWIQNAADLAAQKFKSTP